MPKPKISLVRFKKDGFHFEVPTVPGTVKKYREDRISVTDVIAAENVYTNYNKATRARNQDLESVFGTKNEMDCIKHILKFGIYQETAQEKREETEKNFRNLINLINVNYVDPTSNLPHPPERIRASLQDVKFRFDVSKSSGSQVEKAVAKLRGALTLKKRSTEATLTSFKINSSQHGLSRGMFEHHPFESESFEREVWKCSSRVQVGSFAVRDGQFFIGAKQSDERRLQMDNGVRTYQGRQKI
ncbi:hypothetical protein MHBO_001796 [Bonamia ostreae]|uniref:Uncharacterized protein n=1 Tax=Bonamia ostreae TaxID=126728 RepID=A0ABV2ALA7_9EUKA